MVLCMSTVNYRSILRVLRILELCSVCIQLTTVVFRWSTEYYFSVLRAYRILQKYFVGLENIKEVSFDLTDHYSSGM